MAHKPIIGTANLLSPSQNQASAADEILPPARPPARRPTHSPTHPFAQAPVRPPLRCSRPPARAPTCPQVVLAIAIICVVAVKLSNTNVTTSVSGEPVTIEFTCALGTSVSSGSLCSYVYAVAGISLLVSFCISIIQCCTCNLCGLGKFLDLLFAIAGTVWWVIASPVVQTNVNNAAGDSQSLQNYRDAVVIMMWAEVSIGRDFIVQPLFWFFFVFFHLFFPGLPVTTLALDQA